MSHRLFGWGRGLCGGLCHTARGAGEVILSLALSFICPKSTPTLWNIPEDFVLSAQLQATH